MERIDFSDTGLRVSPLGLGAGGWGDRTPSELDRFWGLARDHGINLVDTARSYGDSEARLGDLIARSSREDFVLSTKIGYGIDGLEDWTGSCIRAGIDAALERLRTDCIDIVHLHSCPAEILARQDVLRALEDGVRAGKVRVAAYSGDNHALEVARTSGVFGSLQATLSILDQANTETLAKAGRDGLGVIAKRALANAVWRHEKRPVGREADKYWDRWSAFIATCSEDELGSPADTFLRWAAHHEVTDVTLVGTTTPAHLLQMIESFGAGALPESRMIGDTYVRVGSGWPALI